MRYIFLFLILLIVGCSNDFGYNDPNKLINDIMKSVKEDNLVSMKEYFDDEIFDIFSEIVLNYDEIISIGFMCDNIEEFDINNNNCSEFDYDLLFSKSETDHRRGASIIYGIMKQDIDFLFRLSMDKKGENWFVSGFSDFIYLKNLDVGQWRFSKSSFDILLTNSTINSFEGSITIEDEQVCTSNNHELLSNATILNFKCNISDDILKKIEREDVFFTIDLELDSKKYSGYFFRQLEKLSP